jgi:hypothetical protein
MESASGIHPSIGHQEMEMGVKIDTVPERLDDGDNPRLKSRPRHALKIEEKRPDSTATKLAQELALVLEKNAQHLGDREDDLAVRNVEEERLLSK